MDKKKIITVTLAASLFASMSMRANAMSCLEIYHGDNTQITASYGERNYTRMVNANGILAADKLGAIGDCTARGDANDGVLQTHQPLIVDTRVNENADVIISEGWHSIDISNFVGGAQGQSINISYVPAIDIPNETMIAVTLSDNARFENRMFGSAALVMLNQNGSMDMFTPIARTIDARTDSNGVTRLLFQVDTSLESFKNTGYEKGQAIPAGTRIYLATYDYPYIDIHLRPLKVDLNAGETVDISFTDYNDLLSELSTGPVTLVERLNAEADSDSDGLSDQFELENGLDPNDGYDARLDFDNDGLTNLKEYLFGTNINNRDSDGDGVLDGEDSEPLNNLRWASLDTDNDGISDDLETTWGYNPDVWQDAWQDADSDGLPAILETRQSTDAGVKDNDVFNSNEQLALQAYVDTQHIIADPLQLERALKMLNNGLDPAYFYNNLLQDEELIQMGFIGRVYQAVMMRNADLDGAVYYRKRLSIDMSPLAMVEGFVNSSEFQNRYGQLTNGDFINLVYTNVMNRKADEGGYNYWLERLNSEQTSRAELMLGFIDSLEYVNRTEILERTRVLSLLISGERHDDETLAEFSGWNQGSYSLMRYLLASSGFRNRVMTDMPDANADTDGDGIPNGVEFVDGLNPDVRDNAVLSDNLAFVKQTYRDLIDEQWHTNTLYSGVSAAQQSRSLFVENLLADEEFLSESQPVARLFFSTFLRQPDVSGLTHWNRKFKNGMKLQQIANVFANSTEFQNRYGALTDSEFIDLVYQNVLGRKVDNAGKQFWLGKLTNGTSRGEMLSGFSESNEGKRKIEDKVNAVLLYQGLLQRQPTTNELHNAAQQLAARNAGTLIEQLLNSPDYSARFE